MNYTFGPCTCANGNNGLVNLGTCKLHPLQLGPSTSGTVVITPSSHSPPALMGWQCPVCFAVMAPFTPACVNCFGAKK